MKLCMAISVQQSTLPIISNIPPRMFLNVSMKNLKIGGFGSKHNRGTKLSDIIALGKSTEYVVEKRSVRVFFFAGA